MASHRDSLLVLEKVEQITTAKNLRPSSYMGRKMTGKEWFPTLVFVEINQLLRVF